MTVTYTIPLPYKSQAVKRKSDALMTINVQRNLHFRAAAGFKLKYGATIRDIVKSSPLPVFNAIEVEYLIHTKPTKGKPTKADPYRGSKPRNLDLLNVGAVVSKVFLDILTELNIIPDDTLEFVHKETFISSPWSDTEHITITLTGVSTLSDPRKEQQ